MGVKVKSKVILISFSKIQGRETVHWGAKDRRKREGQLAELVGDQNPGSEAPPRSKIG